MRAKSGFKYAVPTAIRLAISLVLAAAASMSLASSAHAENHYEIAWTGIGIFPRAEPSMDAPRVGSALPDGTSIAVVCETEGEVVSNGSAALGVWEMLDDGTFLPNAYIRTGFDGWTPGVRRCDDERAQSPVGETGSTHASQVFDGVQAAQWAQDNIDIAPHFDNDCTYFVSQALWAGGLPKTDEWTDKTTDLSLIGKKTDLLSLDPGGPSNAAAIADEFKNYIVNSNAGSIHEIAWADNTAGGAQLGDVIAYDWNSGSDGFIDHLSIVTSLDTDGHPSVSQHSPTRGSATSPARYWSWDEGKGNWLEFTKMYEGNPPRAYLIHITQ